MGDATMVLRVMEDLKLEGISLLRAHPSVSKYF
jgi:hypothetical protein